MPMYDCVLLFKPNVAKDRVADLLSRVGKHVSQRNGVVTDIKSFGSPYLGYGIKKLDGRYFQGQLMQMTMMATPNINKELHYLNKEDRLLRWLLVKHRDIKFGLDGIDDERREIKRIPLMLTDGSEDEDNDDEDEDDEVSVGSSGFVLSVKSL
ncbi:hypothetical protein MLD38_028636 [Melastoma candidum]|uniref:Uncharacterized protein n=1 Tax=Melastoma candidum TaxID=119954 RepID=A0ACB9N1P5_9MYRT|nr:hypothetical protein MLD38_028636 [Melastoma candidum]